MFLSVNRGEVGILGLWPQVLPGGHPWPMVLGPFQRVIPSPVTGPVQSPVPGPAWADTPYQESGRSVYLTLYPGQDRVPPQPGERVLLCHGQ